jgi:hypothetical protein
MAAQNGHLAVVVQLLRAGAALEAADKVGHPPSWVPVNTCNLQMPHHRTLQWSVPSLQCSCLWPLRMLQLILLPTRLLLHLFCLCVPVRLQQAAWPRYYCCCCHHHHCRCNHPHSAAITTIACCTLTSHHRDGYRKSSNVKANLPNPMFWHKVLHQ